MQEGDYVFGCAIAIGCVCKDTPFYDKYGKEYLSQDVSKDKGILGFKDNEANVESITYIQPYTEKECVKITHSYGELSCSIDHPILCKVKARSSKTKTHWFERKFIEASQIKKAHCVAQIDKIDVWGHDTLFDPYAVGCMIGDGSYGPNKTPVLSNCDEEVLNYFKDKYDTVVERERITKEGKTYQEIRVRDFAKRLRGVGIYGQTGRNKRLPANYESLTREQSLELIAGLFDTDGCISDRITITQSSKEVIEAIRKILRKLGILTSVAKIKSLNYSTYENRDSGKFLYRLEVGDKRSLYNFCTQIPLNIKYRQERLVKFDEGDYPENIRWRKIKSIEPIGVQQIYNLTANDSNTYIAGSLITHNTGGSEGSNFYGALEMIYNPRGYNVYALPNVFDKNSQGKSDCVFFFGAYMNRLGYYDEDGVSDITGALIEIFNERVKIKYNTSDPVQLTRTKAEDPITIQEAIMKRDSSIYPASDLQDVVNEIDQNPRSLNDIYVGKFKIAGGKIEYVTDIEAIPVRDFPHKDNKLEGSIEIHKMPVKDKDGKPYSNRYIAGIDPFDDDSSGTLSLGSLFILDLWTDKIVFEYTGRPMFAEEFYETCRRALLFYNARCNYENNKKGLFTYFSKTNSLYLLTDTLEFLRDKDMIKGETISNKSKGSLSTAPIKGYYRRCIRDWLLKPIEIIEEVDGKDVSTTMPQLTQVKSRALLKELIMWNADGNFDRHDALGMLMLLREDRLRLLKDSDPSKASENTSKDYLGNDDFFSKNFRK